MSNEMQEIIDRLGWAENRTEVTNAAMALARHVDARLTALEAKPQAPERVSQLRSLVDENHHLEMDAYHAKADLAEAEAEVERLIAGRDRMNGSIQELVRQRNALAAQLDDLKNVNAGLRKDNERKSELIAALRQNSADLVEAIQVLQAD